MYCHHCGAEVSDQAAFCRSCGRSISPTRPIGQSAVPPPPASARKSKEAAGILAILLGGLGVHKFYMGRIGLGILYLVFVWTLIPIIVGLIEGIIYLVEDDAKFQTRCR